MAKEVIQIDREFLNLVLKTIQDIKQDVDNLKGKERNLSESVIKIMEVLKSDSLMAKVLLDTFYKTEKSKIGIGKETICGKSIQKKKGFSKNKKGIFSSMEIANSSVPREEIAEFRGKLEEMMRKYKIVHLTAAIYQSF